MGKKKRKKAARTKRQQNVAAWNKEIRRIQKWANKQAERGFIVDLTGLEVEPPKRITKAKLQALQKTKYSKLYAAFSVSTFDKPEERLSYDAARKILKQKREQAAALPDVSELYDMAYTNCLSAVSRTWTLEGQRVENYLKSHATDTAMKRRIWGVEDEAVNACFTVAWDSDGTAREASYVWLMQLLTGGVLDAETAMYYTSI